jgi:hypothetical protein
MEPVEALVTTAEELAALWPAGAAIEDVDFSEESVVVVALGERRTGGYSVEVESVVATDDGVVVRYVEGAPGPGCMTTQALTQPYRIIAIPRVEGPARFERSTETRSC